MNLGNSLKKLGIEQTFRYVYKDPEPNMRKLMDWADRFAGNEFEGQRKAIREVIENKDHPYHDIRIMISYCIYLRTWIRMS